MLVSRILKWAGVLLMAEDTSLSHIYIYIYREREREREGGDFSLCLQFRSLSNFTLCLQFRTVSSTILSPISQCLQFRTVSNFALRLQVFTVSPISCFVSRSSHQPTNHPLVMLTSQHHISLRPSHLILLHPFWAINFLHIYCIFYLVHIRSLMSQFYVSIPLVHYIRYHHCIDNVTLLHVSALKLPSSAVLTHFVSRVSRIPVQVKEQPAACYLAAVCIQNKQTCICFFVSQGAADASLFSICSAHVCPLEFGFELLFF